MPINVIVGERNLLAAQASAEGISLVEFVKRAYVLGLQSSHPKIAAAISELRERRRAEIVVNRALAGRERHGPKLKGLSSSGAVTIQASEAALAAAAPASSAPKQSAPSSQRRRSFALGSNAKNAKRKTAE